MHCGELFVFYFTVELFDVYRLEDSHMNATAAVLAPAALPPVLAQMPLPPQSLQMLRSRPLLVRGRKGFFCRPAAVLAPATLPAT